MEKLIAFDLYRKNDQGGHETAYRKPVTGDEVYRADEVHELLKKIRDEIVSSSGLRNEYQDFNEALAAIDSVLMEPGAGK